MAKSNKVNMEKYNSPFAQNLRNLMKNSNTTQDELANVVGKTRQTVSQYINGISEPSYSTLILISNYFDVSIDYLLGTSTVASTDCTVQQIAKLTGLAEPNIQFLIAWNALEKIYNKEESLRSNYEKNALLCAESYINALSEHPTGSPFITAKVVYSNLVNNLIRALHDYPTGKACELYDLYINAELENYSNRKGVARPLDTELCKEVTDKGYLIFDPKEAAEWYLSLISAGIADAMRKNISQSAARYVEATNDGVCKKHDAD